jgi:hypothetical protein
MASGHCIPLLHIIYMYAHRQAHERMHTHTKWLLLFNLKFYYHFIRNPKIKIMKYVWLYMWNCLHVQVIQEQPAKLHGYIDQIVLAKASHINLGPIQSI